MSIIRKILRAVGKTLAAVALAFLLALAVTSVSPIYNFRGPQPFSGEYIFNPYSALDTTQDWKRANFHTHTRVSGPWPMNECPRWPDYTDSVYRALGYDIVTFSNHNEITTHPYDTALQVNVYEQGYNINKYHKLVFGSRKVIHWDPLLYLTASQKQWNLDYLGRSSDFIQMNHPYRTLGTCLSHMQKLSGYQIMELDTSISTENEYWDWALSAGHYSFGLANDDLHYPDKHWKIAIRCNFLQTPSGRYEDLRKALLGGCYYAMRVPDYGEGDWNLKIARNHELPYVEDIGLQGDTIYMKLSEKADSIRVNGRDHATLTLVTGTDSIAYQMRPEDPFARLTAFFPGGEVIYSNPFARCEDPSVPPFNNAPQRINWVLTVLYNLLVLAVVAALVLALVKLFTK
jgi:hypothetical protein